METLKITKKITFEQFISQGYSQKLAENFGMEHIKKEQETRWGKYNPEVYICEGTKSKTYGLGFIVMLRYKADGLNFLKRITSYGSSSITSQGLCYAYSGAFGVSPEITEEIIGKLREAGQDTDTFTTIRFGKEYFDKGESNRKIWRQQSWITLF